MRSFRWLLVVVVVVFGGLVGIVDAASALRAAALPAEALSGVVRSAAEGPMEGVLVSAKRGGSTITTTVVTDAHGRYAFPRDRMAPGRYALDIRAIGYDLSGPKSAIVGTSPGVADLRLIKTAHLADQMTNAEWMISMPGRPEQKHAMLDCTGCHTLQRVVESTHTEDDFRTNVLPRMANYANQSFWLKPQPYKTARTGRSAWPETLAAYLASINESRGERRWPLKTLPRPSGAATRVIVTTYDLPNRQIQPHDVIGLGKTIYYSDFGQQDIGELDPRTGVVTQVPVPELKPGYLTGGLELEADPSGDLWLANLYQGGIARFDPRTHDMKQWRVSPAKNPDYTQESMVFPVHDDVDGKVWTNNQDDHSIRRLDPATGTWEAYGPFTYPNSSKVFNSYGEVTDAANTLWLFDFSGAAIGHFDPATGTMKIIPTPAALSRPRRGRVDDRTGIFWFAEYGANRIGAYDTKADDGSIREYEMPTPWDSPYDVVADRDGDVWTGSMWSDRVTRLDPRSGTFTVYELPRETNIRRVWVDDRTTSPTLWVGSNHGAAIVKVEPSATADRAPETTAGSR